MRKTINRTINYKVRWLITGTWSGYSSSQSRVCHSEVVSDEKLAKAVSNMGGIQFTDGTWLSLNVRELGYREKVAKGQNSYGKLSRECAEKNVNSVEALYSNV